MKKGKKTEKWLPILLGAALGAVIGVLLVTTGALPDTQEDQSLGAYLLTLLPLFIMMMLSIYVQMLLHEAGHLVCGLLSGYGFVSFRIGSLMLVKTAEGVRKKKMALAGTGGQCLLSPPELRDGTFPCRLYMLGGVLANSVLGAAALLLRGLCAPGNLSAGLLVFGLMGLLTAAVNGIPLNTKTVPNDGYNTRELGRSAFARTSLWRQLKINEMQMQGVRLCEMPEEWFTLPEDADRSSALVTTIEVFRENRLMDGQRFDEARAQIDRLLDGSGTVIGLYKTLLMLDRATIDLLERGEQAELSVLESEEHRAVLRQMKLFPSVLRTQYAAALLKEHDADKARALKERFEKASLLYPSAAEIASERSLMELAEARAAAAQEPAV